MHLNPARSVGAYKHFLGNIPFHEGHRRLDVAVQFSDALSVSCLISSYNSTFLTNKNEIAKMVADHDSDHVLVISSVSLDQLRWRGVERRLPSSMLSSASLRRTSAEGSQTLNSFTPI
jgi:hypothetical protein